MLKKVNNNKGFTLIELLAVIVILGVLMIIAVPMVTQYIASAKRSAFMATAKAYVSGARYAYLNGDYSCGSTNIDTGSGGAILVPFSQIKVDKNNGMSSFNQTLSKDNNYVVIESDSSGAYTYYVRMVDEGGNGFSTAIDEDVLKKNDVKIKNSNKNVNIPNSNNKISAKGKNNTNNTNKDITYTSCILDTGM